MNCFVINTDTPWPELPATALALALASPSSPSSLSFALSSGAYIRIYIHYAPAHPTQRLISFFPPGFLGNWKYRPVSLLPVGPRSELVFNNAPCFCRATH